MTLKNAKLTKKGSTNKAPACAVPWRVLEVGAGMRR